MRPLCTRIVTTLCMLLIVGSARAEVVERPVEIFSGGTRVSGTLLHPPLQAGARLPAVVMSHGWGGTAALLRPQAQRMAEAGFFVLVVDYRGWGGSDGRKVHDETSPGGLRELREVVDPLDQAEDLFNAVHWLMGEAAVDPRRVGLWGTSFSGGLAVYVAAREPRVRAIVSQVAWFGQPVDAMPSESLARARTDATRRARGEIGYPPPGAREVGNLRGGPVRESFLRYAPIADMSRLTHCATLIIDAENEELFKLKEHGEAAFNQAPEPRKRVVIPGIAHYGIYGEARERATDLAIEWFSRHLAHPER